MDLSFYRYRVNLLELTLDKNYTLKENRMVSFTTINAYLRNNAVTTRVSNRMPLAIITIGLEGELIRKVFETKGTGKISIEIAELELDSEMEIIGVSDFIRGSYDILPVKSSDNYMIPDGTTEEDVDNSMDQIQPLDLYIYRKEILNYFNQEISMNMSEVSKAAALQAIFRIRNIPGDTVIATPPQDNSTVTNITLPLNTLIGNIDSLNEYYGLYTCTPLIYWDFLFEKMYCINRFNPNITIPSKTDFDTVQFRIKNVEDPTSIAVGSANSLSEKTHLVAVNTMPTVSNKKTEASYTDFSTITGVDSQGNVTKETLDANSTKNEYVVNKNTFTLSQQINDRIVPSFIVALSVSDSSLKIFKPYKTYRFDIDEEYDTLELRNKKFRLGYYGFELHSDGDTDFVGLAEISLYVVDENYRDK